MKQIRPTPISLETRAATALISDLAEALDWELDATCPNEPKVRRLIERLRVELGRLERGIAKKEALS